MKNKNNNLVYSTDSGRICPNCQNPVNDCSCNSLNIGLPASTDGIVRISRQTKGRKGKGVSIINGLPLNEVDMKELAGKLKAKCGTGGTVKDGAIEIQGDNRDKLKIELEKLGYKVKLAGG